MRYVQVQLAPYLSELLTARAEQEQVVLGQVVVDAIRAFDSADGGLRDVRRRRQVGGIRRQILVRPVEAVEIKAAADRQGIASSAVIRAALERYLH